MATFTSIFVPKTAVPTKVAALGAAASSAELVFSQNAILAMSGDGDFHVRFGVAGMAASDITAWRVPNGAVHQFDTGEQFDRIRVFNPTGSPINVYVFNLGRS